MSLHQLYNRAVSTAILLLCTAYLTFLLCLQLCFPFFVYESKFCRCFQCQIIFPAVGYRPFHFFVYNLLLTSPSFIRIQFKTFKLVCVTSSFYKNHVVMFCFGMDRALHQHERVLRQHTQVGERRKIFLKLSNLSRSLGTQDLGHSFSQYGPPSR